MCSPEVMLSILGLQRISMMGKVSGSGSDKASDVLVVTVEAMHVSSCWAYLLNYEPRSACLFQGRILGPGLLLWLEVKIDSHWPWPVSEHKDSP